MAGPDSQIALSDTQRPTEPKPPSDADRLEAGVKAGEYVVERFLGAGAMGEVYAGKHPEIGKRVAIKVLRPSLAASAEAAERFKREARVVNQIDHPNVIDVFAFGRLDDGRLYLVMDLVDGETLRASVADGAADVGTTLDILDQIADALDAAHAKGVVHRDLKPDNVMLSGDPPKVFVLDFGIAKLLTTGDANPGTLLTGQGAWIGTPGYMAPEQWSADGAGPASDRYALGVMAFELLSGKLPFQAPTLPQMMEQHFRSPVPALSTRGAVAARSTFDPVLARAMAKDPTKRYATAKELVAALREASGKKGRRGVAAVRRPWVPAAIGAAVLGIAVVAVVIARKGPERGTGTSTHASSSGLVQLEVRSIPKRATVMRGDTMYGSTPAKLEVRSGEELDLTIKKPGFAIEHKKLAPTEDTRGIDVVLTPITGFEGTWVLPDGQLRAFARSGDEHVDVFKLATLSSEREFYRKFLFEDSPVGVRFAATDTIVDQRAPTEPSCQVPVRVEYVYDAQGDVLTVRPEDVETGFQNGRCVVHSRELVAAVTLVRAQQHADVRTTRAPVGVPIDTPKIRQRPTDEEMKQELLDKDAASRRNGKPIPSKVPPIKGKKAALVDPKEVDVSNAKTNAAPEKPVQKAPPPQQPPPQQPPPQIQTGNEQNAPGDLSQQQPSGDSQVAPQRKKK